MNFGPTLLNSFQFGFEHHISQSLLPQFTHSYFSGLLGVRGQSVGFMSSRLGKAVRLDYSIYHKYGKKVPKNPEITQMEEHQKMEDGDKILAELKLEEKKIRSDLNHLLEIYVVVELESVEEIKEAMDFVSVSCRDFRHIHSELDTLLSEDYVQTYPEVKNFEKRLVKFSKDARKKLALLKKQEADSDAKKRDLDVITDSRTKVKADADLLAVQNEHLNDSVLIFPLSLDLVENYVEKLECLLSKMYETDRYARYVFDQIEYDEHYATQFKNKMDNANQDLKMARMLKHKLVEYFTKLSSVRSKDRASQCHILNAESIFNEIELRCDTLEGKYDIDLSTLSDYQLLDVSSKNLDREFNEILEKITSLASLVQVGGVSVQNLLRKAGSIRDRLAVRRKNFQKDLARLVGERDVTPDKLKNATMLKIEIPKFTGYDSKMDLFTFKTEFKKLVEPVVKNTCWPDYLKRNYLSGSALTLVEKETDYSKIWEKLFDSYGNARYLLQT